MTLEAAQKNVSGSLLSLSMEQMILEEIDVMKLDVIVFVKLLQMWMGHVQE